ncbi:MAG: rhomboid family intramembrane serine protease [Proteobacteria bacterium]|nr:rhomboid family intramembrane serine protease [Pseudomonadota bacterium]
MIIIFPLSHERTSVKRIPIITLILIMINVLLFVVTAIKAPKPKERFIEISNILYEYYHEHPYLEIPETTRNKLFSAHPELLKRIKSKTQPPPQGYQFEHEQTMINKAIDEYEDAYSHEFYRKYGYIPAQGGFLTLLYSMFLHAGFFHLFFNMIFLFLSGYILEDHWGRIIYLLFYLSGGIVATLFHGYMFPESFIPLVGASGAIAALMGAFLIRFFRTRIYFFYFIIIFIKIWTGRFLAPAFIVLPLWLLQQAVFAIFDDGSGGGVAFWAHIGGFSYGCLFALFMKFFTIEEKFIAHSIDKKITVFDADSTNTDEPKKTLSQRIQENGFERRERANNLLTMGEKEKALFECKRALVLHIKHNEGQDAMAYYTEMNRIFPNLSLKNDYQIQLIGMYEKCNEFKQAAMACKNLIYELKDSGDEAPMIYALCSYARLLQDHLGKSDIAEKVLSQAKKLCKDRPLPSLTHEPTPVDQIPEPQPVRSDNTRVEPEKKMTETNKHIPWENIRFVEELNHNAQQALLSVAPWMVTRVSKAAQGLSLEGSSAQNPIDYDDICFITAFQFDSETNVFLDMFIKGEKRPYRLNSSRISYPDFFETPYANVQENFRHFVIYLLSKPQSIYTDRETYDFAHLKKIRVFGSNNRLTVYEKRIWSQLITPEPEL